MATVTMRQPMLNATPRTRLVNKQKRVFDVVAIVVFSPIIVVVGLATAITVGLGIGRPVLFRQVRIGFNEQRFTLLKFRSMTDARNSEGDLLSDSKRLTSLGSTIRRLSVDEVPQLLNVLRGDMSIVGPRPLLVEYLPFYSEDERRRHVVRPGITGFAQTSGRNFLGWEDRLKLDAEYVDNVSLPGDLRILINTVKQAFGGRGVSVIAGDSGEPLHIARSYPVTDELGLRGFLRTDVSTRVAWMTDPGVREHMRLPAKMDDQSTLDWYRAIQNSRDRHDLTVYDRRTGEPRAMLGLKHLPGNDLPELYIFTDPKCVGKGVGHQSMELLFRWLESSKAYEGCRLSVHPENVDALALYKRMGFTQNSRAKDGRKILSLTVKNWEATR